MHLELVPSLRRLRLSVVACLSSLALSAPLAAQSNLIVNGGAETGDLSGWTDVLGHGFGISIPPGVYAGDHSFHAGLFGPSGAWNHEVRQDVDVSAAAAEIDAGAATSVFSAAGRSNQAGSSIDSGSLTLQFLDAAGTALDTFASGVFVPTNTWIPVNDTRAVPAGTRTIRVTLFGTRPVGLSTDCFFDALTLRLDCAPRTYCTAKVNSLGCTPAVSISGAAQLPNSTLAVQCSNVLNNRGGLLFWGQAPAAAPFQGGLLCVQPPTLRTPVQQSGGSPSGVDCTGTYSFAFTSSYLASVSLSVGDEVDCQFWSRDPASPSTTGLSDAAHFCVTP